MENNLSVGTDIIEVKRFREKPLEKNKKFYNSIFSKAELSHCIKYANPYSHLAGIFAAKESVIKCLGKPITFHDIEIKWNKHGKPSATIPHKKLEINVTISHTDEHAIAFAVIIV